MRFAAFDSFQGLPRSDEKFTPSGYFPGAFSASQEEFMRAVRRVPKEQLHILPGYFSELTVPGRADVAALGDGKIAVCYIDCDVFEGCRDALNFITDRLQTGSMIIIDDWNRHHAIPGAGLRRAVQEWLDRNPQIELTQIFVSKRVLFSVLVREPN